MAADGGMSGPFFQWSDTWQLVVNTGTTIITFLVVFLIQNTQNRDTEALQLKLDELIRANEQARNRLLRLEESSEDPSGSPAYLRGSEPVADRERHHEVGA